MAFDLNDLKDYCYHDGTITELNYFGFRGEFPEDETERSGLVGFYYYFEPHISRVIPQRFYECKFCDIISFDIEPKDGGYDVKLCAEGIFGDMKREFFCAEFHCELVSCMLYKYFGMSYKNLYSPQRVKQAEKYIADEYFKSEETFDLGRGHTLVCKKYAYEEYKNHRLTGCFNVGKYTLKRDGEDIYGFICSDDHFGGRGFDIIEHSSGHRYLWYHTDLYGISFVDIDTLQAYSYIPEGLQHDYRSELGESFIITDVHYDRSTDLVAYGGCRWAGPGEVFVGDLKAPLAFDPVLTDLRAFADPDNELCCDLDFVRWENDAVVIINSDEHKECRITIDEIRKLREQKKP